jgi:RNA polymerase sigma-70 factor (ECF subfamily)
MNEDLELVRSFCEGNEAGFDELVRRYQQRVYALVYRFVRNPEDATELAQDVFVRAYRALPGFRGKSSFYTWLYRIAVNVALSFLRRRRRRGATAAAEQLDQDAVMNLPSPESPVRDFEQVRLREVIAGAVDALPARQRAIFIMRRYEELTNDEIAETLRCPVGTVKANYFFAVKSLQKKLKGLV